MTKHIPEPGPSPFEDGESFAHLFGCWVRKGDAARDPGGFGSILTVSRGVSGETWITLGVSGAGRETYNGFTCPEITISEEELREEWHQLEFPPELSAEPSSEEARQIYRRRILDIAGMIESGTLGDIPMVDGVEQRPE